MSAMRAQVTATHNQQQQQSTVSSGGAVKPSIAGNIVDPRKLARPPSQTKKKL
jgi:hypothetical protein